MSKKPSIAIIGTGNLAYHLGNALKAAKIGPKQICGRNEESAKELAQTLDCSFITNTKNISEDINVIIICVSDDAIELISDQLPVDKNVLVLHTSGSTDISTLNKHSNHGILYPLQSFKKHSESNFSVTPIFICGNNSESTVGIKVIAGSLSNNVHQIKKEELPYLHLAAVFVSNFSNHMYYLGEKIINENNVSVPFDTFKLLASETMRSAFKEGPAKSQTGPAKRGDKKTIESHLNLLNEDPKTQALYKLVSDSIQNT